MDSVGLLISALLVGLQALWLGVALLENLRHPGPNSGLVRRVMRMEAVRLEPVVYDEVKGNRVERPALHRWAFRLVVLLEIPIWLGLVTAVVLLALAAGGGGDPRLAQLVALGAVAAFTLLWGLLLAGGEWFYYWLPDPRLQVTHFLLLLWGVATLAVLR